MIISVSKLIIAILYAVIVAYISVMFAEKYINYKQSKYPVPKFQREINKSRYYIIFIILGVTIMYLGLMSRDLVDSIFLGIFIFIAFLGTVVDNSIRIIGNEMILFMLLLAIPYRIYGYGLMGLLGSLASSIGIALVFLITHKIVAIIKPNVPPAGAGDLKLLMVIGFILGYQYMLVALFVTSICLVLYIAYGYFKTMLVMNSYLPLAGFVMIGLITSMLVSKGDIWIKILGFIS